jgi:hypothetical protein
MSGPQQRVPDFQINQLPSVVVGVHTFAGPITLHDLTTVDNLDFRVDGATVGDSTHQAADIYIGGGIGGAGQIIGPSGAGVFRIDNSIGTQSIYAGRSVIISGDGVAITGGLTGQTQTFSGSGVVLAFDPSLGEDIMFTASGNVTSLELLVTAALPGVGFPNQRVTLRLQQDAGGASSWPTSILNVKMPGGTFTKTPGASAVDLFFLVCDGEVWWASPMAADLS